MADDAKPTIASDPSPADPSRTVTLPRDRLARMVVVGSFLTIFLLVVALLTASQAGLNAGDLAEKTLNVILPVLAAWVGSVLAFYFSQQSNEATSQSLRHAIGLIGGGAPSQATVAQTMISVEAIRGLFKLEERSARDIPVTELRDLFASQSQGGPITRLVFIERGQFRYVLHVSILSAYLAANPLRQPPQTLADLLAADDYRSLVTLVAFVTASATVAQAKTALDAVAHAQDVIVTTTGDANGLMLGWITNVDLIKALAVS